jgi:hypothetical protein
MPASLQSLIAAAAAAAADDDTCGLWPGAVIADAPVGFNG